MFKRMKQAVVQSLVGAVALGYLLASCVQHFVNIFSSPLAAWVLRREFGDLAPKGFARSPFQNAFPELASFVLLLLVWYLLLRWLYFKSVDGERRPEVPSAEQPR